VLGRLRREWYHRGKPKWHPDEQRRLALSAHKTVSYCRPCMAVDRRLPSFLGASHLVRRHAAVFVTESQQPRSQWPAARSTTQARPRLAGRFPTKGTYAQAQYALASLL